MKKEKKKKKKTKKENNQKKKKKKKEKKKKMKKEKKKKKKKKNLYKLTLSDCQPSARRSDGGFPQQRCTLHGNPLRLSASLSLSSDD